MQANCVVWNSEFVSERWYADVLPPAIMFPVFSQYSSKWTLVVPRGRVHFEHFVDLD